MRYPAAETSAKHERILKEASRLFREQGFDKVTVVDVMNAAGLTHGGFYSHFSSKQELQAAAVAYGLKLTASRTRSDGPTKQGRRSYASRYLTRWHRDNPGDGCTLAALAQDGAHSAPEIKATFERGLNEILSADGERQEAIARRAALIGSIVMARAVSDSQLSDEILDAVREKLGCGPLRDCVSDDSGSEGV